MSRQLLVLDEVLAIMKMEGVPEKYIDAFKGRAEFVSDKKHRKQFDNVSVASGFGQKSQKGFVELAIDDTLTQMDAKKAQEIGLMLITASEAAQSDEIFMTLLEKISTLDSERRGYLLLELREIRQGSKTTVNPS